MMSSRIGFSVAVIIPLVLLMPGCTNERLWEVTVENKHDQPCSFHITMRADGSSKAKMDNVVQGKARTLIVGKYDTIVHTVKVVRGQDEKLLT